MHLMARRQHTAKVSCDAAAGVDRVRAMIFWAVCGRVAKRTAPPSLRAIQRRYFGCFDVFSSFGSAVTVTIPANSPARTAARANLTVEAASTGTWTLYARLVLTREVPCRL